MQRSTFKVLFYVKRQSEKSGQIPVMAVLRSTVRCRSSAANSPFVLLFGIPRQIKQPQKPRSPTHQPNVFVFCAFTGLSYANVSKLTHTDIHTDDNGDRWIIDKRQKTGTQFRVKLLPVAEMIYDCYKDMHLSGDRAFPLKGTYNTLNMSLRHVTRHAGCRSIRRSMWPGIHLPRRSRSRRAYRWKPYRRCWDINISPRPKFTPKSPTTRSDKI